MPIENRTRLDREDLDRKRLLEKLDTRVEHAVADDGVIRVAGHIQHLQLRAQGRQVLGELAHALGIPCLAGIPVGHIAEQWTIPLGAMGKLDTATSTLTVTSYKS